VAAGETRVGLLFGAVETRTPTAGGRSKAPLVRGRTSGGAYSSDDEEREKVVVKVAAVLEVGAPFQQHGYVCLLNSWKVGNVVRLARS